jgi:hypothetical protein
MLWRGKFCMDIALNNQFDRSAAFMGQGGYDNGFILLLQPIRNERGIDFKDKTVILKGERMYNGEE